MGFAFLALFAGLLLSCSFDYGSAKQTSTEEEPTATFTRFVHRVVDQGTIILEIRADRAESYDKDHRTELQGVTFSQFDSKGALEASGKADSATVWTDTDNAEFRGDVLLESKREKATLKAESLSWTDSTKVLEGGLERIVSVQRDDGSWVSGAGFRADLKRRAFSFQEASEGRMVTTSSATESTTGGPTK
ncbi:MAG TPA: LPS export ABC transporter periplasmic protein LptC [Rectinemataceae bacterium]|nr:LPS export ABC transporter periplasmic protein LptC [Rectinemataceae bacterium]